MLSIPSADAQFLFSRTGDAFLSEPQIGEPGIQEDPMPADTLTTTRQGATPPNDMMLPVTVDSPVRVILRFLDSSPRNPLPLQLSTLQKLAQSCPDCTGFSVYRDPEDASEWMVVSDWRSRDAFNRFIRQSGLIWLIRMRTNTLHLEECRVLLVEELI